MLGPLPGHAPPAQGHTTGFVADQPRRQPLGETHLGGQGQRPPAGRLAARPRTLVSQRPQGLAAPSVEDGSRGVGPRRWRLERGKAALVEGMNGVAHRLIGAAQVAGNHGRRLPLGTGQEHLAAAYREGGRGPETGLSCGLLVRRKRAYK